MTIYEIIKATISVKQAAKHYGLNVDRNGMACCPFHNDRHPSLKLNEDYFFCFGCGAKGDVIDVVARLFDLSSYEAAQKLVADFGLDPKPPTTAALPKPKHPCIRQFREDEMMCFRVLTDYLHLLEDWKGRYVPKTPDAVSYTHLDVYKRQRAGTGGESRKAVWIWKIDRIVGSFFRTTDSFLRSLSTMRGVSSAAYGL